MTNRQINKEILNLSLKIGNGITDAELGKTIHLLRPQLEYRAAKVLNNISNEDMNDFMSDVTLKILMNLDKWNPKKGRLTTWTHTICYNDACKRKKENAKMKMIHLSEKGFDVAYGMNQSITVGSIFITEDENLVEINNPYTLYIVEEDKEQSSLLIDKIEDVATSLKSSIIFNKRVREGMSIGDISKLTKIPQPTIYKKMENLRSKAADLYTNLYNEIYLT